MIHFGEDLKTSYNSPKLLIADSIDSIVSRLLNELWKI